MTTGALWDLSKSATFGGHTGKEEESMDKGDGRGGESGLDVVDRHTTDGR